MEKGPSAGLRAPQLGAIRAILAHRTMEAEWPITVVMPTGTGKTETMMSVFCESPRRTLVVVPSDEVILDLMLPGRNGSSAPICLLPAT